jgi:peptidyl-prolyl cis-trans isomerase D
MIRFLQTPGPIQKALLIGFLTVVCIMMVVTLVPGGIFTDFGSGSVSTNALAKVAGEEVTISEVKQTARGMLQQRRIPEQYESMILPQALDAVVLRKVYLYEAERYGLRATDDDLRYEMQHSPLAASLYPGGKFIGTQQYRNLVLSQFNLSIPEFERALRDDLTMRRLRSVLDAGVSVSDAEVHKAFLHERTRVRFDYAVLSTADVEKIVHLEDSELRAYYEKNQQQFANTLPEKRKVRYVVVDPERLPNAATPELSELQRYYRQHVNEYRNSESVDFRHILIKLPLPGPDGKVDAKQAEEARKKAQDVLDQLHKGGDFAALAKKYSDDAATAAKGGVVGKLVRGSGSAPEIEAIAFSLPVGKVSDLISTSYGFEIVRVDSKTAAQQRSFDDVRREIEPLVAAQKNQELAANLARKLEKQAQAGTLEKAAAADGLLVHDSDWITRNDALPGIGLSQELSGQIFSMQLKAAPTMVPLASGYAVVQVTEIKPASTPSFEQVKETIANQLRQQKAETLLAQALQKISEKARAEHNLTAVARSVGAKVMTSELVARDAQVPEIGQLDSSAPQIFEMKPGEISQPINFGTKGVVVALREKVPPTEVEYKFVKDEVKNQLLERKRAEVDQVFVVAARERLAKKGKLVIDHKKLDELVAKNQEQ